MAAVEAGLTQRSQLLNAILADIYGPQTLLRDGSIPPALLFANPAFLRPCHGIVPAHNLFLFLHGVDLGRSPDGQWWVLSDRTQAPSGAGYTLQNRMVLSHVMPDEFRDCRVERLAGFFEIARNTLRNPRPAPQRPALRRVIDSRAVQRDLFRARYLARYLGFPLVQGADLTVRDRRVYLKTLEGLQQVDVILRRADDTFCDPLELRADSFLGAPGLVDAARAGNVAIANAPRQRRGGNARPGLSPAGIMPPPARRRIETPVSGDVVVRPARRAPARQRQPRKTRRPPRVFPRGSAPLAAPCPTANALRSAPKSTARPTISSARKSSPSAPRPPSKAITSPPGGLSSAPMFAPPTTASP